MLSLEETFNWHLEAFESEHFTYISTVIKCILHLI